MDQKPNLPEQIRSLSDGIQPDAPDDSFMRGYRFGHRAARHAAAELAAAALSAAPAQEPVAWRCPDCCGLGCATCNDSGALPQEVKALTDAKIEQAWWSLGTEPDGSNLAGGTTLDGWKRAVRWAERELRGAQEVSASSKGEQR